MKTALVTGSEGFVGRHIIEALDTIGIEHIDALDIKNGSAADCRVLLAADDTRYDLVLHCAAVVGGRVKIDGAPMEVAYDFGLDSDVIQFCARTRPGRVILFSSSAAYPTFLQDGRVRVALREDDISFGREQIGQPDSVYGWCKIALEVQARELAQLGIKTHVFRPFSGYGSDQDDGYPWPDLVKRAMAGPEVMQVWSNVGQTRDWIHIDDVVAQVMTCIVQDQRGPINLCTGIPTSFWSLVSEILDQTGYHGTPIDQELGMPSGVHYRVGDPAKINQYYPARISVAEGIERSIKELS